MSINVDSRQNDLMHLQNYFKDVDSEVTMILQNLQWDRKYLIEKSTMVVCQYDANHRVPPDKLAEHEKGCFLKCQGYSETERLLPSPIDPDAATLVKLNADDVAEIINNASHNQTLFKRGVGCGGVQPLSLARLQAAHSADERRALHDAVAARAPAVPLPGDLPLLSTNDKGETGARAKSRLEMLAELRDMKRRRVRYRVAPKTRNYSHVLRDVISTQMEMYAQPQGDSINQTQIKNNPESHKDEDVDRPKEKTAAKYYNDTPSRSRRDYEETASCSSRDRRDESRHSKRRDGSENRKRRHNDDVHTTSRCSKPEGSDRSSHTYEKVYDRSKRRDDAYTDSAKVNIDRHNRYDECENRRRYRDERDHDRTKSDGSWVEDKYRSYKHSSRGRQEYNEYGNLRHNSEESVKVKKEKYYNNPFDNGGSGTEYSLHYKNKYSHSTIVKGENEVYVKTERNNHGGDRNIV